MSPPEPAAHAQPLASTDNVLSPQHLPNSEADLGRVQDVEIRAQSKDGERRSQDEALSKNVEELPVEPPVNKTSSEELNDKKIAKEASKEGEPKDPSAPDNVFAFAMANASAASDQGHVHKEKQSQKSEEEWNEKEDDTSRQDQQEEAGMQSLTEGKQSDESRPEINDIMSQSETTSTVTSPQSGISLPVFQYPPRSSSLSSLEGSSSKGDASSFISPQLSNDLDKTSTASTAPTPTVPQPPLPEPEPESDLPFDFHRFLEQLRNRTADPVAGYLRSFLNEFSKRQPPLVVHEQQKVISNFLAFISTKMAQCEVWRNVSEAEFDNAREGMEKLVMNRLYTQTFSPAIAPTVPDKNRRKGAPPLVQGRRGQHQEDVERDEVLAQKVRIYGWIREEHLDMKPFSDKGRRFLSLAQQELSQVNKFRAPRDKVICILNCCKVLFGFLRNAQSDQSADAFIPLLIYTVLKTNPDHLVSNVQYIVRFRNPDKLSGEAGYYMSSLMGAVQFIENLDRTNLTISDADFEEQVEKAVSAIAERQSMEEERRQQQRASMEAATPARRQQVTSRRSQERQRPQQQQEDGDPVAGILRTIQKPLSAIGRVFSDEPSTPSPTPVRSNRLNIQQQQQQLPPDVSTAPGAAAERQRALEGEDAAARQASVEAAEAHTISRQEHQTVVETLQGMFPQLEKEIISDVVRMKGGRVGLAVDACLALSR